jgi:hypothetical protein
MLNAAEGFPSGIVVAFPLNKVGPSVARGLVVKQLLDDEVLFAIDQQWWRWWLDTGLEAVGVVIVALEELDVDR